MPINAYPMTIRGGNDAYLNQTPSLRSTTFTGSSGAVTISPAASQYSRIVNPANNVTVSFTAPAQIFSSIVSAYSAYNLPGLSGYSGNVWFVEVNNRGSFTVLFNNITWDGGTVPTFATTGKSIVMFYSPDGGTTIYGSLQFANI